MAVVRSGFRAEQAGAFKQKWIKAVFYLSFHHQIKKLLLVLSPVPLIAFKRFQHRIGRREQRLMLILYVPDIVEEKARSSGFAKADSCDVLYHRKSYKTLTPAETRRSKNPFAFVLVKPIVVTSRGMISPIL